MRDMRMTDVMEKAAAEQCDVEVQCYLDGRGIVVSKADWKRAWRWTGDGWVAATLEDRRRSVKRD